MKGVVSKVLISLASLVFALALAEGALQIFYAARSGTDTPASELGKERPEFYYLPSPSTRTQDRALAQEKPAGTFRIAVVGDSFSFAPKMQYDDAFSKRLERLLNLNSSSNGPYQRVEVLNLGSPGFNTLQEVQLIKESLQYSPDLVLLQITLNDAQLRALNQEPLEVQQKFGRLSFDPRRSWILRNSLLARLVTERLHNRSTVLSYIAYHHELFSNPESKQVFDHALDQAVKVIASSSTPPVLAAVIFPLFDFEIDDAYPFTAVHQVIRSELKARDIRFLDLTAAYRGIPAQRLQLIPGKDSHPNELGHRIAAEKILRWLLNSRLIPLELAPQRVLKQRDNVKEPVLKNPWSRAMRRHKRAGSQSAESKAEAPEAEGR